MAHDDLTRQLRDLHGPVALPRPHPSALRRIAQRRRRKHRVMLAVPLLACALVAPAAWSAIDNGEDSLVQQAAPDATPSPTPSPSRAPEPTPPPAGSPPARAAQIIESERCAVDEPPASHEQASQCLYAAVISRDAPMSQNYATAPAATAAAALAGFPQDELWQFEGCGEPQDTKPSSGMSCRYLIPADVHGVAVEMAMAKDFRVEAVSVLG